MRWLVSSVSTRRAIGTRRRQAATRKLKRSWSKWPGCCIFSVLVASLPLFFCFALTSLFCHCSDNLDIFQGGEKTFGLEVYEWASNMAPKVGEGPMGEEGSIVKQVMHMFGGPGSKGARIMGARGFP